MIRAEEQLLQSRSMQHGIGRHNPNFVLSLAPIFASGLNHMSLVLPHRSMCCWEDDVSSCRNSDSTTPSRGPALSVAEILLSSMSSVAQRPNVPNFRHVQGDLGSSYITTWKTLTA
jgi:hypothetical protein